jgi:hypothetical protein
MPARRIKRPAFVLGQCRPDVISRPAMRPRRIKRLSDKSQRRAG